MVTGVIGGSMDVNALVSQLMQIERQPLNRLQQRENQIQSRLTAFGRVQGALSNLPEFARAFFSIWLDDRTRAPQLRATLFEQLGAPR